MYSTKHFCFWGVLCLGDVCYVNRRWTVHPFHSPVTFTIPSVKSTMPNCCSSDGSEGIGEESFMATPAIAGTGTTDWHNRRRQRRSGGGTAAAAATMKEGLLCRKSLFKHFQIVWEREMEDGDEEVGEMESLCKVRKKGPCLPKYTAREPLRIIYPSRRRSCHSGDGVFTIGAALIRHSTPRPTESQRLSQLSSVKGATPFAQLTQFTGGKEAATFTHVER